jgi:N6-adenosine-specific RNA methylase IME4
MKGNSKMIALVSAFKCINIFLSGERKFSKKGPDNFTGVLNRLTGSEAMSKISVRLLYMNTTLLW